MEKPTPAALEAFDAGFPNDERAVRKKMFGMPAGFVNGNMFCGVFADGVVLRVPQERRESLAGEVGIEPFEPMPGRPWKDYVHASATTFPADRMGALFAEALAHTEGLPPKVPKPRKATKAGKKG